jgi:transcriptional regulator with PAS, ATPase and Fis domain
MTKYKIPGAERQSQPDQDSAAVSQDVPKSKDKFFNTTEILMTERYPDFLTASGIFEFEALFAKAGDYEGSASVGAVQKAKMFLVLAETSSDVFFLKDRSFKYVYVNPAMARQLNRPQSQLLGRNDHELFGIQEAAELKNACEHVLQGWTVRRQHKRTIEGIVKTFIDTLAPWKDDLGKISGIYGSFVDMDEITEFVPIPSFDSYEYPSQIMRETLTEAHLVAGSGSTVLLLGESGSGKDFLATYIHDHSDRAEGPFQSINCAAIPSDLMESELFGHEKGAFSGATQLKRGLIEHAHGGTLFLNEIGELSLPLQAKLLTFLDSRSFRRVGGEKQVNVSTRIIAATNKDLERDVHDGRFRDDLFHRMNVFAIRIPSLRERKEDIPILVNNLLQRLAKEMGLHTVPKLPASALDKLLHHDWPGNVRELRNVLEKAVIRSGIRQKMAGPIEGSAVDRSLSSTSRQMGQDNLSRQNTKGQARPQMNPEVETQPGKEESSRPQKPRSDELIHLYDEYVVAQGWTRAALAKSLGVDSSTLKKWFKSIGLPEGQAGRPIKP